MKFFTKSNQLNFLISQDLSSTKKNNTSHRYYGKKNILLIL